MSDDIYDDDSVDVVQPTEIAPSGPLLHAPDAIALAGPTHHQGADYGVPDTTVTVVEGTQCVHDGVTYEGGETVVVPATAASYWVRSAWATTPHDTEPVEPDSGLERDSVKSPARTKPPTRRTSDRSGRRSTNR